MSAVSGESVTLLYHIWIFGTGERRELRTESGEDPYVTAAVRLRSVMSWGTVPNMLRGRPDSSLVR